jgi:hypothetical protein
MWSLGDVKLPAGAPVRGWVVVLASMAGIAIVGLVAEVISTSWRPPAPALFVCCAGVAPLFGLGLFVELAVVMGHLIKSGGPTDANRATAQALVRMNSAMLVLSEGSSLYAVGTGRRTAFLVTCGIAPWLVQLLLLVDCTYLKVGLHRIGTRGRK